MSELLYDSWEDKKGIHRVFNKNTAPKMIFILQIACIGAVFFSITSYEDNPVLYLFVLSVVLAGFFLAPWQLGWFRIWLRLYDDHLILYGKVYSWEELSKVDCDWEGEGLVLKFMDSDLPLTFLSGRIGNKQKLEAIMKQKGKLILKNDD